MILSVLRLERSNIKQLKIRDAYGVHKMVYSLFPGENRDFLYVDSGGDPRGRSFLILSQREPRLPSSGHLECKTISDSYLNYDCYAFQVQLNPVRRLTGSKIFRPITGVINLREWFLNRQQDWGFEAKEENIQVEALGVKEFHRGNQKIIHNKATFKGMLIVKDRERFRRSFIHGIGRGKAFGFGLLQLRPLNNKQNKEDVNE